jgi:hypothetical protein
VNTVRISRFLRRATLPVALVCLVLLWWNFGWLRVPIGMDTMGPEYPPGALCLIHKRPGELKAGQVVFVDYFGDVLLTRVERAGDGWFTVAHDRPSGTFGHGAELGRLTRDELVGLVLTTLTPGPNTEQPR